MITGIPRCPHEVYSPDGDGQPSIYCSGCHPPQLGLPPRNDGQEGDEEELAVARLCPRCASGIIVGEEYDFNCLNCGFDGFSL